MVDDSTTAKALNNEWSLEIIVGNDLDSSWLNQVHLGGNLFLSTDQSTFLEVLSLHAV